MRTHAEINIMTSWNCNYCFAFQWRYWYCYNYHHQ